MRNPRAVAFIRKASPDQFRRDRDQIAAFAERKCLDIIAEIAEPSNAGIVTSRGLARAVRRLESRDAHILIVADQASFDLDPTIQAVGLLKLAEFGISLIAADDSTFTAQITVNDLTLVIDVATRFEGLLRSAAERGVSPKGRSIGPKWRKQYVDLVPEAVALAKNIYGRSQREGRRVTLREISADLARSGLMKGSGKPFHPQEIDRMIKGPSPRPPR